MPISLSAKKSLRKSLKNHKGNVLFVKKLKLILRTFDKKPSKKGLNEVYSVLDKAKKRNVYHPNKVARLKAKFSKLIKKGEVKSGETKKTIKKTVKKTVKKTSKKM